MTRFLRFKNYEKPQLDKHHIQELRFRRVPFGVISSPFLLGATIECHLNSYKSPLANQLKENTYMDNVISGTNTLEEAISLYRGAKSMFNDAKMNLREWMTNSEDVNNTIANGDLAQQESIKVLGHIWNTKFDTISIKQSKMVKDDLDFTKRNVLKQLVSVFDPIGFFVPVTMSKHLDWDDPLDKEDASECLQIKSDLMELNSVEISRCVSSPNSGNVTKYILVCFCDASIKAFAMAIYLLQQSEGHTKSDLMFSKS